MSDPERLLAGGASDVERDLLRAWEGRQPSPEARRKAMAVVTLGAASAASAAATASSFAGGAAAKVTGSLAPKALVASSLLLKTGAGVLGLALATGAFTYLRHTRAPDQAQSSRAAAPPVARPASPLLATTPLPEPVTPAQPAAPISSVSSPPPPPTDARPRTASPSTLPSTAARVGAIAARSTLGEEVSTIDGARRAISSGDAGAALAQVDAYDARFPSGSLAQESREIRIEALLLEGNRSTAEPMASRFLMDHPKSPYARRLRALLAGSAGP